MTERSRNSRRARVAVWAPVALRLIVGYGFMAHGMAKLSRGPLMLAGLGPQRMTMHIAFRVSAAEVVAAPEILRSAGVTPLDFDGQPTDEPVVITWMPDVSVFFRDPDGHLLE